MNKIEMKDNKKIFEAICIKNYTEEVLDGSKNITNDNWKECLITITHYKEGDEVYYKYEDGFYYISKIKEYLYKLRYYHTEIVEIEEKEFDKYFILFN